MKVLFSQGHSTSVFNVLTNAKLKYSLLYELCIYCVYMVYISVHVMQ